MSFKGKNNSRQVSAQSAVELPSHALRHSDVAWVDQWIYFLSNHLSLVK